MKMLERYQVEGLVFGEREEGEFDKIFSVFCFPLGKIKILAKGIRKINSKLCSQIGLFSLVEIELIRGKFIWRLVGAKQKENFPFLRKDLKKVLFSFKIGEILDTVLKEEDFDERVWGLILKTFQKLNQISFQKEELLYLYFTWKLIAFLGYSPQLERCVFCKKQFSPVFYFSEKEGGISCQKCAKKAKIENRVSKEELKLLKLILNKELEMIEKIRVKKETLKLLFFLTQNYLNFQILS